MHNRRRVALIVVYAIAVLVSVLTACNKSAPLETSFRPRMTDSEIAEFRKSHVTLDGSNNIGAIASEAVTEDLFADCNMALVDAIALVEVVSADGADTQTLPVDAAGTMTSSVTTYNYRVKITEVLALRRRESQHMEYKLGGAMYSIDRLKSSGFIELKPGDECYLWYGMIDPIKFNIDDKFVVAIGFSEDERLQKRRGLPLLGTGSEWTFYLTDDMHIVSMTTEFKGTESYTGYSYEEFKSIVRKYVEDNKWERAANNEKSDTLRVSRHIAECGLR